VPSGEKVRRLKSRRERKQTQSSIKRKIKGERRRNIFIAMFILALLDMSFGSLRGNDAERDGVGRRGTEWDGEGRSGTETSDSFHR
jgi:hypothetical protein